MYLSALDVCELVINLTQLKINFSGLPKTHIIWNSLNNNIVGYYWLPVPLAHQVVIPAEVQQVRVLTLRQVLQVHLLRVIFIYGMTSTAQHLRQTKHMRHPLAADSTLNLLPKHLKQHSGVVEWLLQVYC